MGQDMETHQPEKKGNGSKTRANAMALSGGGGGRGGGRGPANRGMRKWFRAQKKDLISKTNDVFTRWLIEFKYIFKKYPRSTVYSP